MKRSHPFERPSFRAARRMRPVRLAVRAVLAAALALGLLPAVAFAQPQPRADIDGECSEGEALVHTQFTLTATGDFDLDSTNIEGSEGVLPSGVKTGAVMTCGIVPGSQDYEGGKLTGLELVLEVRVGCDSSGVDMGDAKFSVSLERAMEVIADTGTTLTYVPGQGAAQTATGVWEFASDAPVYTQENDFAVGGWESFVPLLRARFALDMKGAPLGQGDTLTFMNSNVSIPTILIDYGSGLPLSSQQSVTISPKVSTLAVRAQPADLTFDASGYADAGAGQGGAFDDGSPTESKPGVAPGSPVADVLPSADDLVPPAGHTAKGGRWYYWSGGMPGQGEKVYVTDATGAAVSGAVTPRCGEPRTYYYEYERLASVSGTVVWEDADNGWGTRPADVEVALFYQDGNGSWQPVLDDAGKIVVATASEAGGAWAYRFDGLPYRDGQGNAITYGVRQYDSTVDQADVTASDDYEPPTYDGSAASAAALDGGTVTNRLVMKDVSLSKQVVAWEGSREEDEGRAFDFAVTVEKRDGSVATVPAEGISYIVSDAGGASSETRHVGQGGMVRLSHGQTATFAVPENMTARFAEAELGAGWTSQPRVDAAGNVTVVNTHAAPQPVVSDPGDPIDQGGGGFTADVGLSGRDMETGEFAYAVADADGNAVAGVGGANDAAGKFPVGEFSFDRPGTYEHAVFQIDTQRPGVTYDQGAYTLVAEVTLNEATNELEVTWTLKDEDGREVADKNAHFDNVYAVEPTTSKPSDPPASGIGNGVTVDVELSGRDMAEGEFEFVLTDADGAVVDTGRNLSDGSFSFNGVTFDAPGSYVFGLSQVETGAEHVTYDGADYQVRAEVTDNGDGTLSVVWSVLGPDGAAVPGNAVVWRNVYAPPAAPGEPQEPGAPQQPSASQQPAAPQQPAKGGPAQGAGAPSVLAATGDGRIAPIAAGAVLAAAAIVAAARRRAR